LTSVHQKPTNTGVILNFNTVAPLQWKRSLILCFFEPCFNCVFQQILILGKKLNVLKLFLLAMLTLRSFLIMLLIVLCSHLKSLLRRLYLIRQAQRTEGTCVFLRMIYVGRPSHKFVKRLGSLIRNRFGVDVKVGY